MAHRVGAEPELPAGSLIPHGSFRAVLVHGVVDLVRGLLVGEQGLDKGEHQKGAQGDEQHPCQAVLPESLEGAAPVGIVGIAGVFGLTGVKDMRAELLGGQGGDLLGGQVVLFLRRQLPLQLPCQAIGHALKLSAFFEILCHYRLPSPLFRLMRGSTSTISRSPRNRPTMPSAAKISTSACTMVLSCRWMTLMSRPPMPGTE